MDSGSRRLFPYVSGELPESLLGRGVSVACPAVCMRVPGWGSALSPQSSLQTPWVRLADVGCGFSPGLRVLVSQHSPLPALVLRSQEWEGAWSWPRLLWNGGRLTWAQDPTLEGPRQIAAGSVGAACLRPTLPPSCLQLPRLLQPQPLGKHS